MKGVHVETEIGGQALSREEALLREGGLSYPLALAAIGEYQRLVWRCCSEAVEAERSRIATVIGSIPGKHADYLDPGSRAQANGSYAALGVCIRSTDTGNHFFALWWESGKVFAAVWTEFKDRERANRALASLRERCIGEDIGRSMGTEVWLRMEMQDSELSNPAGTMRTCIKNWCEAWGGIGGGLKQFL
jgi:hypothetical protein